MPMNSIREETSERKPTGWSGYPPGGARAGLGSILPILPRHGSKRRGKAECSKN